MLKRVKDFVDKVLLWTYFKTIVFKKLVDSIVDLGCSPQDIKLILFEQNLVREISQLVLLSKIIEISKKIVIRDNKTSIKIPDFANKEVILLRGNYGILIDLYHEEADELLKVKIVRFYFDIQLTTQDVIKEIKKRGFSTLKTLALVNFELTFLGYDFIKAVYVVNEPDYTTCGKIIKQDSIISASYDYKKSQWFGEYYFLVRV